MAGRPPFQPTKDERDLVTLLAGLGIDQDVIRSVIRRPSGASMKPISRPTLRKHFREELDTGALKVEAQLAGSLVKRALDPKNPSGAASAMFMLKARFGWKERQIHEHEGSINLDLSGATDAELAVLEKFLKRKVGDAPSPANDSRAA